MTEFKYTVIDPVGRERTGIIKAPSEKHARTTLRNDGDLPVEVRPAKKRQWLKLEKKTRVSYADAAAFALELSGLLEAGAPLRKALIIQADGNGASANLAAASLRALDRGDSLSSALGTYGGAAELLSEFVRAGESGGGLSELLSRGGYFMETRAAVLKRLSKALAYPLFVLIITLVAIFVLFLYVAPALAPIFRDAGQQSMIVWMADIGEWAIDNQSLILITGAVVSAVIFFVVQTARFRNTLDAVLWRSPYLGTIIQDLDTGQSCDVLSALLERGRPLEVALKYAASVAGPTLSKTYTRIGQSLRDGSVASAAFGSEKALPKDVRRLIVLGEKSSAFAKAIKQAGDICRERAFSRMERLASVVGPTLVISLGVLISILMLSVLQSLAGLTDSVL